MFYFVKIFFHLNSNYITCPYQHFLRYKEKWYPKQKPRALSVGSAIHACSEAFRKGELDSFNFNMTDEIDLKKWLEYYKKYSRIITDYEFVYIEKAFKCRGFIGIIDGLVRNKRTGKLWIYEMKTFSVMPNEFDRIFRPQPYIYYQQLKNKGINVDGVVWEYVKSDLPKEPVLLKNGKLSKTLNSYIIPDTVYEACRAYNLDPNDYKELIEQSRCNIQNYFDVKERYITPSVAETMFDEFKKVRINSNNKHKHINSLTCKMCSYKDICLCELTGGDKDYLLEMNYEKKEGK